VGGIVKKNGKLLLSHRYNQLPLLYSYPGGVLGAGRKRLAGANIQYSFKK
jgi:hypothetical protein